MTEKDFFNTIEQPAVAEYRDRGSKFLAYVIPLPEVSFFKEQLNKVKSEHIKATHHCFAYRIGLDGNTFRVSDDGEPAGTAGKPILGQIDSKDLTNVLIIVARYFGGTLLGVPGLITAYKTAASLAIQMTAIVQKPIEILYSLHFNYTQINEVMTILKQCNCTILKQEMQLFCDLTIGISKSRLDEVLYKLNDLQGVEVTIVK